MHLPLTEWPSAALTVARSFGWRGARLRSAHEIRRRLGAFRRRPRWSSADGVPIGRWPFRVDGARLVAATDVRNALARADRVIEGEYEAYRWDWRPMPGGPESWLRHPRSGIVVPAAQGWWRTPHFAAFGDIKDLWEPARFGWTYDLVRAWLLTHDDRYAAFFHARLADWLASSPPYDGPHWACGQETAIRAVALLYAEANLSDAPSSTPEAMSRIRLLLAASGERIADAFGYAVSQGNNHALSEALGLLAIGMRCRDHPESGEWRRRGTEWLNRLVREQFASDGWYAQHSFTYLRLALDQCIVAQRLLRANGDTLSTAAVARLAAAVDLVCATIDPDSGEVPNHGANDGAFVHPITLAPYRDFRPVLTAACATFGFPYPRELELDAEVLAWLGAPQPPRTARLQQGVRSGPSGWVAARLGAWQVFFRAGSYRSRPSHADPLHVDVRFRGEEIIVDPGTYSYAERPWATRMAAGRVHNGPLLDGREPGVRGPRFLWYRWPDARLVGVTEHPGEITITGEIPSRVRREIRIASDCVDVTDRVLAIDAARITIRWLLHPSADVSRIAIDGRAETVGAQESDADGWYSPRYGERIPSRSIVVDRAVQASAGIRTRILDAAPSMPYDARDGQDHPSTEDVRDDHG